MLSALWACCCSFIEHHFEALKGRKHKHRAQPCACKKANPFALKGHQQANGLVNSAQNIIIPNDEGQTQCLSCNTCHQNQLFLLWHRRFSKHYPSNRHKR